MKLRSPLALGALLAAACLATGADDEPATPMLTVGDPNRAACLIVARNGLDEHAADYAAGVVVVFIKALDRHAPGFRQAVIEILQQDGGDPI